MIERDNQAQRQAAIRLVREAASGTDEDVENASRRLAAVLEIGIASKEILDKWKVTDIPLDKETPALESPTTDLTETSEPEPEKIYRFWIRRVPQSELGYANEVLRGEHEKEFVKKDRDKKTKPSSSEPVETKITRSDEENRVLGAMLSSIRKGRAIDFGELQRTLRSDARITTHGDRTFYRPYQADEIVRIFNAALKKILKESKNPETKANWSPEEIEAWEEIEALAEHTQGRFRGIVSRVRRSISNAQRNFYQSHPTRTGRSLEYLEVD